VLYEKSKYRKQYLIHAVKRWDNNTTQERANMKDDIKMDGHIGIVC